MSGQPEPAKKKEEKQYFKITSVSKLGNQQPLFLLFRREEKKRGGGNVFACILPYLELCS